MLNLPADREAMLFVPVDPLFTAIDRKFRCQVGLGIPLEI